MSNSHHNLPKSSVLQYGRAIAAFLVVLVHASGSFASWAQQISQRSELYYFGEFGVEFFFVLSGYLIYELNKIYFDMARVWPRYIFSRLYRIYPLFWLIFTFFLLAQVATDKWDPLLDDVPSLIWAFALLPFQSLPPLVSAWTLSHEILFYSLFSLLLIHKQTGKFVLCAWFVACIIIFAAGERFDRSSYITGFFLADMNILFLLGISISVYRNKIDYISNTYLYILIFTSFFLTYILVSFEYYLRPSLVAGVGFFALVALSLKLERRGRIPEIHWLRIVGDASYAIYLVHIPVIVGTLIVLDNLSLIEYMDFDTATFMLAGVSVIVGLIVHYIMERPLLQFGKRAIAKLEGSRNASG